MSAKTFGTATKLATEKLPFKGVARLYRVDPPMVWQDTWNGPKRKTAFVVVSAVVDPVSGPETYIFPTDRNGEVKNWGELEGSYRGGLQHGKALLGAGYKIAKAKA